MTFESLEKSLYWKPLPTRRTAQKDLGIAHFLTSFESRHVSHASMGDHLTGDARFEFLAGLNYFEKISCAYLSPSLYPQKLKPSTANKKDSLTLSESKKRVKKIHVYTKLPCPLLNSNGPPLMSSKTSWEKTVIVDQSLGCMHCTQQDFTFRFYQPESLSGSREKIQYNFCLLNIRKQGDSKLSGDQIQNDRN